MTISAHLDSTKRHDFVYLFDIHDGNPNGDPDNGNMPRTDPETMHGLMTDGSLKRKIRDWVDMMHGTEERNKIYIQSKGIALNDFHARAYTAKGITPIDSKQPAEDVAQVRSWMCENFYDVRMFGGVMNTKVNCGQVRGPVQMTFARSVDPISPIDVTITRVAITKVGTDKTTEMGRKAIVPYALYRASGYYIPHFARQSGVDDDDLRIYWEALQSFWDIDRSATRGTLALRGIYIYTHQNPLGNGPAHRLLEKVSVEKKKSVPRSFEDYSITIDSSVMPTGVTLTRLGVD